MRDSLLIRWLVPAVAALLAIFVGESEIVVAQDLSYRPAGSVPVAWGRYAELVRFRLIQGVERNDAVTERLHLFLEGRGDAGSGAVEAVVVKVWVQADGTIHRVEFPSLGDIQADDDLRTVLTREAIGEAPPHDMLQPLHLQLSLKWRT